MARFFRRGKTRVYFLPAVSNLDAPTTLEIAAGTEITSSISAISGFNLKNTPIATPDLATTFNSSIPGEDTTDASSFTMYDDDASSALRTTLTKGTAGFILLCPYGNVSTKRAETWPVVVTSASDVYTMGNDPAHWMLEFSVSSIPHQHAVLP